MGRPSNSRERRNQLADAMIEAIAKSGYEGATIQQVGELAGLTSGLVHYHFANKFELLLATQDRVIERHCARIDRWMARGHLALEKVRLFIDCHLARGAEEDAAALACWIALTSEALRDRRARKGYQRGVVAFTERLESALAEAVQTHAISHTLDIHATSTALFAVIQGYYTLHGVEPRLVPRGTAATNVQRMAEGLLKVALPDVVVIPPLSTTHNTRRRG